MVIQEIQESFIPPLKWAGGKRWLRPIMKEIWQESNFNRLVEPFAGGMAISLGILPVAALLNDINPHLINFYRHLQKGLIIELEFRNEAEYYYQCREKFNNLVREDKADTQLAAELFYYLNKQGYNGLCRFNNKGEFNVPFGKYKKANGIKDLTAYSKVIQDWSFLCGDFTELTIKPGDLIYADPPYDVDFTKYSKQDWGWDDQVRLAEWLASSPSTVVASNQATPRIITLYQDMGFEVKLLQAPRMISNTGNRTPATEMLAYKKVKHS